MIVLSRANGESIMIGDAIEVTAADIDATGVVVAVSRRTTKGRFTQLEETHRARLGLNEAMKIDDGIDCIVRDLRETKVRLGFMLPATVALHRKEIYQEIFSQTTDL